MLERSILLEALLAGLDRRSTVVLAFQYVVLQRAVAVLRISRRQQMKQPSLCCGESVHGAAPIYTSDRLRLMITLSLSLNLARSTPIARILHEYHPLSVG